jgi:hypothetical protein
MPTEQREHLGVRIAFVNKNRQAGRRRPLARGLARPQLIGARLKIA